MSNNELMIAAVILLAVLPLLKSSLIFTNLLKT
jgi:hypothetical protein